MEKCNSADYKIKDFVSKRHYKGTPDFNSGP